MSGRLIKHAWRSFKFVAMVLCAALLITGVGAAVTAVAVKFGEAAGLFSLLAVIFLAALGVNLWDPFGFYNKKGDYKHKL